MRNLIDLLEHAPIRRLGDLVSVKTNSETADFWIERRGSMETVGRPSKSFLPHGFAITVTDPSRILPDYLFYVMLHLWQQGAWKQVATGTTNLVAIRASDVTGIPLSEGVDETRSQTPVEAFLDAFVAMSEDNPISPHMRVLDGVLVKLGRGFYDAAGTIDIDDIQSRQRGAGTAAMKAICELADHHGVRLELHAKGYAHVTTQALVRWYESLGFQYDWEALGEIDDLDGEGVDMWRAPQHKGPLKLRGFSDWRMH